MAALRPKQRSQRDMSSWWPSTLTGADGENLVMGNLVNRDLSPFWRRLVTR